MFAPPANSRKRVLAISGVIYVGLVAGGMSLTYSKANSVAPRHTVAVALEAFDSIPAPPPPASTLGGSLTYETTTAHKEVPATPSQSEETEPEFSVPSISTVRPAQSAGPVGGSSQAGQVMRTSRWLPTRPATGRWNWNSVAPTSCRP